ncbi:hypothetical protein ACFSQD_19605 [Flavihumibacter stibioxidans]|uniref:DUF4595 domain-containing protein n=1 Tax=Flavihumibacter stibioxidans TaxID=1834163 RepID=A0ABR7M6L5_9BACT|nr:hypothetical protein [Flavihumibacter stibioxidans]MBC6490654.1 hypothetical protein [Flavihumibacter stibioxidans]
MFRNIFQLLSAFFLLTVFTACQKEINSLEEEIEQPEQIPGQLPKQIVLKHFTDNYTEVWSMQYDNANRRINVYYDDTTNANPYDVLKASYQFNTAGYLVKFINSDGIDEEISEISRDANNRIRYITNRDALVGEIDTSFYSYENSGTQLKHTIERHAYWDQSVEKRIDTYTYNNNVLQNLRPGINGFDIVYQYQQNKLTNTGWSGNGNFFTMSIAYLTPDPDEPKDLFLELVLGKDHYVQDIRDMYFFFVFQDRGFLTLSASDPHHVNSFSFVYKSEDDEGTDETVCSYEFNDKGQPVSIFMQSGQGSVQAQYLVRY